MRTPKLMVFLCLLVASNVGTFFAAPYFPYIGDYVYFSNFEEPDDQEQVEAVQTSQQDCWHLKEDKSIYIGVVFPDRDVVGNGDAMKARAEGLLFLKDANGFHYAGLEKRFGHHTYYFHPMVLVRK